MQSNHSRSFVTGFFRSAWWSRDSPSCRMDQCALPSCYGIPIVWLNSISFTFSSVGGLLSCFHFLLQNVTLGTSVCKILRWKMFSFLLGTDQGVEFLGWQSAVWTRISWLPVPGQRLSFPWKNIMNFNHVPYSFSASLWPMSSVRKSKELVFIEHLLGGRSSSKFFKFH